jgi:hypothetical protein
MKDIHPSVQPAHALYEYFRKVLLSDTVLHNFLLKLEQNIQETRKEMVVNGMAGECADCFVNGEGTCCGMQTGSKYDRILLLINILLGQDLPLYRQFPEKCYFLRDNGCALKARHVICLNFICKRLRENIQHENIVRFQKISGEELQTLFMVEEYIKKWLSQKALT